MKNNKKKEMGCPEFGVSDKSILITIYKGSPSPALREELLRKTLSNI